MDWLDLLAVQGTLKSLLQYNSSNASILQPSAFFTVQLSHPFMTTGKTIALTRWTLVGKVMSLLFFFLASQDFNIYFLFKKLIYFNWRLITLQYCSGFCHTLTWISHGYTCVHPFRNSLPSPSTSHPPGLSQCTGFECPASCIELGLAVCFTYGDIHVSVLFSQIISPSPSAAESKSLFLTSVSLLLSCI